MNNINLDTYKVIFITNYYLYNPITPLELFVNKCGTVSISDFPEEYKKSPKINNVSEAISFFCEVFHYSLVSVSMMNSYYIVSFKKEEEKKDTEFLK